MRLVCRRVPREEFSTRIRGLGADLTVRGRVIWSRKIGFSKSEVGIEFIEVAPELAQQLTTMAMNDRFRRAV